MNRRWLSICLISLISPAVFAAGNLGQLDNLNQDLFKDLTSEMGASLGYKALITNDPLSKVGYELGLDTPRQDHWDGTPVINRVNPPPRLNLQNAPLPGLDFDGYYTSIPDTDISLMGGLVSYPLTDGGRHGPAIAIRGTYSRLTGVEDFHLTTRGLELSFSKGFDSFTPYAGLGTVWIDGETDIDGLNNESLSTNKYFMGFNFDLGLMSIAAETEQTGDSTTARARFGLRF